MLKKAVIGGVVLFAGMLAVWLWAWPGYRDYQEGRALGQARRFLAAGDWANASLSARRVLGMDGGNAEACGVMARVAAAAGAPEELEWRRRAAELAPSLENRLALAAAALRVEGPPWGIAARTLAELKGEEKGVAGYEVMAGELALKLNRPAEAEGHFVEASRLEPWNGAHRLNVAVLRLRGTNGVAAAAARSTLEELRGDEGLGGVALRWLVGERMERGELAAAEELSRELVGRSDAVVEDRLTHLEILRRGKGAGFEGYLEAVQQRAGTNAAEVYAVCAWMVGNGLAEGALRWLTNCAAELRAQPAARLALADGYAGMKDWGGLERFLEAERWGEQEYLRLALLSQAARELKEEVAAAGHWRLALVRAGDRAGALRSLWKLASSRGWEREREEVLWALARRHPAERWALEELERGYAAAGDTRGLNRVYAALVAEDGKDVMARNNLAATSMLLKLNLPRAHELAREVYGERPGEAVAASTYAYSLHLQGRTREGLAVMGKLAAASLESPGVALYYGVLLQADGRAGEAESYLARARQGRLLPEEREMAGR